MDFREMRREAWKLARAGWVYRIIVVYAILGAVFVIALYALQHGYEANGIQTWARFGEAKMKAKLSGMDLVVPSTAVAWQMTGASVFENFVNYLFSGIFAFGLISVLLKAVKGESDGWFGAMFGGFRQPFGMFWLNTLMMIRIMLWSLLFIVPGVIAAFRYALAWYVKAEHPELSASRCLAESSRLMDGNKGRLFLFSCSYWKSICLSLLPLLAGAVLSAAGMTWAWLPGLFLTGGCAVFTGVYVVIGQAVFYREVKREKQKMVFQDV